MNSRAINNLYKAKLAQLPKTRFCHLTFTESMMKTQTRDQFRKHPTSVCPPGASKRLLAKFKLSRKGKYGVPRNLDFTQFIKWESFREGLKKRQIVHILWISVLPPPLIRIGQS